MKPRFLVSAFVVALAAIAHAADQPSARFVRVSLSGEKRVLTLAEVEVKSGGKNIATAGKETQS